MATAPRSRVFIPVIVGIIGLAWLSLVVWGQSPYARYLHHDELAESNLDPGRGLLLVFVASWTLMTIAMMLPTSLPLLTLFQRMTTARSDQSLLVALLLSGYLGVWALFGGLAHWGDRWLHEAVQALPWLEDRSWVIGATTLLVAGAYQFTPLKYHCLEQCRSPLSFILSHWRGRRERWQAFWLGMHHGFFCLGCCWSLMLLMFVVGVGNLAWMLGLAAVMAAEKNLPWGRRLSVPLGLALLYAGVALTVLHLVGLETIFWLPVLGAPDP